VGGGARAPGLDGVRALAVFAVIAFHEQFAAFHGGFLGVDVFFVLSGYLITDLLAAHWARHGRLDLRGFWIRRARRLLPALAVVLVTVTAAVAVIEPGQLGALRPALLAAVSYSSNWWQALQHQSYFAGFGPPPPLRHLWSLAIEEQFYLVWPLILIVTLRTCQRRRLRAAVALAGAALSAVAMAAIYVPGGDPSRVYYGTDTHASALFIGAALAFAWPLRQLRAAPRQQVRRADAAGLTGIAVLAWAMSRYSGGDGALYPAGLLITALGAGGLVVAAASPGVIAGLLSWAPLRWAGVRSYGIYLWHWPVIAIAAAITGPRPGAPWLGAAEAATAITLAAASWKWIEQPILRNGLRATVHARYRAATESSAAQGRGLARAFFAAALAAALMVAGAAGYGVGVLRAPTSPGLEQQITQGAMISADSRTHKVTPAAAARVSAETPPPTPASTSGGGAHAYQAKIPGSKVTAIGDSVMLAAAPQLQAALKGIYIDAAVSRQMSAGLAVVQGLADAGLLRSVVVLDLGTNGTVTTRQIRQLLATIGPHHTLVLVNTFVPRPWQNEDNRVLAAAARKHDNVVLANWFATIEHRTGLLWDDDVHPRPRGATLYARMVATAVQATRNPRPTASQWSATCHTP
jgi:peptidoglycan/LPS O-acetylase OafA/YrhL